jgi:catechol 2,3-dioxygenase-like lactoylglutathione lyase family enzyme
MARTDVASRASAGGNSIGAAMRIRLDHVQIAAPVGCEAEARRFFGGLIGLPEVEKPKPLAERGGVWFAVGDHQLHVGVDPGFTAASKAHPAHSLPREDLDDLARRLGESGERVDWDTSLPGRPRFYCRDPWGNRIEFVAERR